MRVGFKTVVEVVVGKRVGAGSLSVALGTSDVGLGGKTADEEIGVTTAEGLSSVV